jgi:hypothetical protein
LHPVVQMAIALQAIPVPLPSTLPWGDRRDLHPLGRGSRPRASTTSASTTVRLEGIAPSPLAYRAIARLSCYRRSRADGQGDWNCTSGLEVPNPALFVAELHPGKVAVPEGWVSPSGCHTTRRPRSFRERARQSHVASESNAAIRIWSSKPSPDGATYS